MHSASTDTTATSFNSNDYHVVPATEKQIRFARNIAQRTNVDLPAELTSDRHRLSRWIDANQRTSDPSAFSNYPTSKQVAFAERIARAKRRDVPRECFQDRTLIPDGLTATDSHAPIITSPGLGGAAILDAQCVRPPFAPGSHPCTSSTTEWQSSRRKGPLWPGCGHW